MWTIWQENMEDLLAEHPGPCPESTLSSGCPAMRRVCIISYPEPVTALQTSWWGFSARHVLASPVTLERSLPCGPFSSHLLIEEVNDDRISRLALGKSSWKACRKYLTDPQPLPFRCYKVRWSPLHPGSTLPLNTPGGAPWWQASFNLLSFWGSEGFLSAENQTGLRWTPSLVLPELPNFTFRLWILIFSLPGKNESILNLLIMSLAK